MNLQEIFAHKHHVPKGLSADVKISTFFWTKMGDEAIDHEMDL